MRKLTLFFAFLLTMFAGTQVCAETTDLTTLPDGWSVVGATHGTERARTGNAVYTSAKDATSNYLLTGEIEGSLTFYWRSYGTSSSYPSGQVFLYEYNNGTVGNQIAATSTMKSSTWTSVTLNLGNYSGQVAIGLYSACIDDITYTPVTTVNAPSMKVSATSYDFGLATAGTAATFKITNNGNIDYTISASATGGFGTSLSTTTLNQGDEATLTVTMPAATSNGVVTISSSDANIADATIIVCGMVKDDGKLFADFSANAIPEGWSQNGTSWSFASGYASNSAYSTSGTSRLISPRILVNSGDKLYFKYQKNVTYTGSYYKIIIEYTNAEDLASATWTTVQEITDGTYKEWKTITLNIPSDATYIAFNAAKYDVDDVYGLSFPTNNPVSGVSLNESSLSLQIGENITLTATIAPTDAGNKKVTWSTSDASVATVANGVVTAVAEGTATITVTTEDGGYTATCDVTVNPVAVTGVSLDQTELTLVEGKTATLTATVAPDNAANKNITWSTSDAAVATVNNGTVTAVAAGTATITVTTEDANFTAICAVTVNAPAAATMDVTLDGEEVPATVEFGSVNKTKTLTFTVANNGDMNLSGGSISLSGADAASFSLSKTYLMVAAHGTNTFDVTFNSTDEDVQKTATITLTAGELTKSFTVTGTYVNMWSEDFEGENPLVGWDANGFTIETQSGIGYSPVDLPSHFAVASYNGTSTIVTPKLSAHAGDELSFDAYFYWGDENNILNIEYSEDRNTWTSLYIYNANTYSNKSTNRMTITAPIEGSFYLRFTGKYSVGLDNFEGFKLAAAKEHEAEIKSSAIPATGNQYVEYTASVDVKVLGTSDEELTAKFFIGDTQYGEDVVKTVTSGETETFTVTFASDAAVSGDAYFTITNNDIDLTTEPTAVTIVGAYALSEADTENNVEEGNYPVVELTFTVKNGWNSIALPFAVSDPTVFGESVRVYSLDSFAEGTLSFSEKNTMYGCDPYIIYVEGAKTGPFLFNNVSISSSQANESNCYTTTPPGEYTAIHKGTWTKMSADGLYGIVNATGDIRLGTSNATFKAFRSYFDLTYPEGTEIKMNFVGNDGISTTINAAEVLDELNGNIYDMSGRKVSKVQKGIYIQNGKKVVIK